VDQKRKHDRDAKHEDRETRHQQLPRSVFSSAASSKFADSSIVRRNHITVTAAAAPMTNAIRQPQACICSAVSNCCKMICTPSASSWPLVSVTYWNEE
jgi:hypothetical protein